MMEKPVLYGIMAEFATAEATTAAVQAAYAAGYRRMEAYSPYPVPALADALRFQRTYLPTLALLGGLVGCLGGFFMQYYFNAISYPLNVGGRPLDSWPSFIPVTFELTILAAVLSTFIGVFALNRLPMLHHPVWNVERFARASHDRFFLCIEACDPNFHHERTRQFLAVFSPEEVTDVPAFTSDQSA